MLGLLAGDLSNLLCQREADVVHKLVMLRQGVLSDDVVLQPTTLLISNLMIVEFICR